jgi:hypothetical protein
MTDLPSEGCANQTRRFGTLLLRAAGEGSACGHSLSSENGLETAHQQENDDDQQDNPKDTAGTITPASAMGPCRNDANQDQNEQNKKNGPNAHDVALPDLTVPHGKLAV